MPDARHVSPCSCVGTCGVAIFTEWDETADNEGAWFVEFYEHISYVQGWRRRVRVAWAILRGREPWTHGVSLQYGEIVGLRDFLNERTALASPRKDDDHA